MASKSASIPIVIASPPDPGECTASYFVQYRVSGALGWTLLDGTGLTTSNPIVIEPLAPSTLYDLSITRNCCNGQSNALVTTFTTPA